VSDKKVAVRMLATQVWLSEVKNPELVSQNAYSIAQSSPSGAKARIFCRLDRHG
jgi:hypothetical protein